MNKFIVILRLNKEGGIFTRCCNEFSGCRDIEPLNIQGNVREGGICTPH